VRFDQEYRTGAINSTSLSAGRGSVIVAMASTVRQQAREQRFASSGGSGGFILNFESYCTSSSIT